MESQVKYSLNHQSLSSHMDNSEPLNPTPKRDLSRNARTLFNNGDSQNSLTPQYLSQNIDNSQFFIGPTQNQVKKVDFLSPIDSSKDYNSKDYNSQNFMEEILNDDQKILNQKILKRISSSDFENEDPLKCSNSVNITIQETENSDKSILKNDSGILIYDSLKLISSQDEIPYKKSLELASDLNTQINKRKKSIDDISTNLSHSKTLIGFIQSNPKKRKPLPKKDIPLNGALDTKFKNVINKFSVDESIDMIQANPCSIGKFDSARNNKVNNNLSHENESKVNNSQNFDNDLINYKYSDSSNSTDIIPETQLPSLDSLPSSSMGDFLYKNYAEPIFSQEINPKKSLLYEKKTSEDGDFEYQSVKDSQIPVKANIIENSNKSKCIFTPFNIGEVESEHLESSQTKNIAPIKDTILKSYFEKTINIKGFENLNSVFNDDISEDIGEDFTANSPRLDEKTPKPSNDNIIIRKTPKLNSKKLSNFRGKPSFTFSRASDENRKSSNSSSSSIPKYKPITKSKRPFSRNIGYPLEFNDASSTKKCDGGSEEPTNIAEKIKNGSKTSLNKNSEDNFNDDFSFDSPNKATENHYSIASKNTNKASSKPEFFANFGGSSTKVSNLLFKPIEIGLQKSPSAELVRDLSISTPTSGERFQTIFSASTCNQSEPKSDSLKWIWYVSPGNNKFLAPVLLAPNSDNNIKTPNSFNYTTFNQIPSSKRKSEVKKCGISITNVDKVLKISIKNVFSLVSKKITVGDRVWATRKRKRTLETGTIISMTKPPGFNYNWFDSRGKLAKSKIPCFNIKFDKDEEIQMIAINKVHSTPALLDLPSTPLKTLTMKTPSRGVNGVIYENISSSVTSLLKGFNNNIQSRKNIASGFKNNNDFFPKEKVPISNSNPENSIFKGITFLITFSPMFARSFSKSDTVLYLLDILGAHELSKTWSKQTCKMWTNRHKLNDHISRFPMHYLQVFVWFGKWYKNCFDNMGTEKC
ncbi:hypothetical protein AYI68_g2425 [Smittium mucronatum]|uniref:Uncharacterized protein n=1 Tax=Smittium mucronatum TaxID=133383 RepID=A0A1R0H2P9_9FUNG|nr:hypothetical protein AYI68_g2425 [Smittium mucronatum]